MLILFYWKHEMHTCLHNTKKEWKLRMMLFFLLKPIVFISLPFIFTIDVCAQQHLSDKAQLKASTATASNAFNRFSLLHPLPRIQIMEDSLFILGRQLRLGEMRFIKKHSAVNFSFDYFRKAIANTRFVDADTLLAFFSSVFTKQQQGSLQGKQTLKAIYAGKSERVGGAAPDYTAKDINGKWLTPASNAGKYVVVDFWASWCVPCIRNMPILRNLYEQYDSSQLIIISVTLDEDLMPFNNAIAKNRMEWKQIFGNWDLIGRFNVIAVPEVFLISPAGMLVYDSLHNLNNPTDSNDVGYGPMIAILKKELLKRTAARK